MKILSQLLRFLARLTFMFLFHLLVALARFVLLPFFQATLGLLLSLLSLTFAATVSGPGEFTDRLAAEWTRRLVEMTGSRERIEQIYGLCRFVIGILIVLGWLVSFIFTILILRIVFGYFI